MIKPTVGRAVHFYLNDLPLAATIAYVHNDRLINIGYLDTNGNHKNQTSVQLVQDDDMPISFHCRWMDYQIGKAAKTEALEAQIATSNFPVIEEQPVQSDAEAAAAQ